MNTFKNIKLNLSSSIFLLSLFCNMHIHAELLEHDFTSINHNTSSERGVPLSNKKNDPSGSDGRASAPGTYGQFRGFYSIGAAATPKSPNSLDISVKSDGKKKTFFDNADNINIPRGKLGSKKYFLTRASIGGPTYGRKVNFLLGQVVDKPDSLGVGKDKILIGTPSTYWADEPYIRSMAIESASELKGVATIVTKEVHGLNPGDIVIINGIDGINADNTVVLESSEKSFKVRYSVDSTKLVLDSLDAAADDDKTNVAANTLIVNNGEFRKAHESLGYYYSPHGKLVVSIKPGPIQIVWRERGSFAEQPPGENHIDWTMIEGSYYKLHSKKYTVSASPAKDAQKIYWNKEPFYDGPLVVLPEGLGEINIIYNSIFPKKVSPTKAIKLNESGTGQTAETELRTLWVNQVSPRLRVLSAFNISGRVIIEILGDVNADGTRQHLGFEIVDVIKRSVPADVTLDLGDRIRAFRDGNPVNDETLIPDVRDRANSESSGGFSLQKKNPGTEQLAFYAIKETEHKNDLVSFWMRKSIAGLAWPVYHNRYHLQWPEDSSVYSHYVRPDVDRIEAIETAVNLPAENGTTLFYQDKDSRGKDRAIIDGVKFYSWLDKKFPTHRALIGHETVKGGMSFEHILSWLDLSIKNEKNWPDTEQVKHLEFWPKIELVENSGVPRKPQGSITLKLYDEVLGIEPSTDNSRFNHATSSAWTKGTGAGISAVSRYNFWSSGDGNIREEGINPLGEKSLIWKSVNNDVASNADGGWWKWINVPTDKAYISALYFKRVGDSASGRFYHGTYRVEDTNGTYQRNPYFSYPPISDLPKDVWCVSIGVIRSKDNQVTNAEKYTGIYRLDTGEKIVDNKTFKMRNLSRDWTVHRTYLYYSTNPKDEIHWWNPYFGEINGNEPSFQEFLSGEIDVYVNDGKIFNSVVQSNTLKNKPNEELTLTEFKWSDNSEKNYASHFQGYFHPPQTGYYTFAISSDDQGELFLSTDSNPANVELVSYERTKSDLGKFSDADLSSTKYLVEGNAYYIESFHIQSSGNSHILASYNFSNTVNNDANVKDNAEIIKGNVLSPWSPIRDLTGGIKVKPLKYAFQRGESLKFDNASKFVFDRDAKVGETIIFGSLEGDAFSGQIATKPSISIMPIAKNGVSSVDSNQSIHLNKTGNSQFMTSFVNLGNTDIAIELWFNKEKDLNIKSGIISLTDESNFDLSVYLGKDDAINIIENNEDDNVLKFKNNDNEGFSNGIWHNLAITINSGDIVQSDDKVWSTALEGVNPYYAIDNFPFTYYSNSNSKNSGIIIKTKGGTAKSLILTSADKGNMDPSSYSLYGSNNEGKTFVLIDQGDVPRFNGRFKSQAITLRNDAFYKRYKLIFPETVGGGELRVAEVELIDNKLESGFRVYVDNVLRYTDLDRTHLNYVNHDKVKTNKIILGNALTLKNDNDIQFFSGRVDELRIWNAPRTIDNILRYDEVIIPPNSSGLSTYFTFDGVKSDTSFHVPNNSNSKHKGELESQKGIYDIGVNLPSLIKVDPLSVPISNETLITFNNGISKSSFKSVSNTVKGDTEIIGYASNIISEGQIGQIDDTALFDLPRVITKTVNVGSRIKVPNGEKGSINGQYWAGFIQKGTAYNPNAYTNPLDVDGFNAANEGAIIPVNANPSDENNKLTVYWFREKIAKSDPTLGFKHIYWPSIIAEYKIEWPQDGPEIVLASNSGSGSLNSLQQKGRIYRQNNSAFVGYNPNEEHALILGGQVWALRNDLNIRKTSDYTSEPYVLLEYIGSDGRPSMTAFKVLSEKPDQGILFDYITEAGKVLQAPQPLPLLDKATHIFEEENEEGEIIHEVGDLMDREVSFAVTDKPEAWKSDNIQYRHYEKFTTVDKNNTTWVYRGPHKGMPELRAGYYNESLDNEDLRWIDLKEATVYAGEVFEHYIHTSILGSHLQVVPKMPDDFPSWIIIDGLKITGFAPDEIKNHQYDLVVNSSYGESVNLRLKINILEPDALRNKYSTQSPLDKKINGFRYVGRPPSLSVEAVSSNSFKMKFWYKNLEVFDWPLDINIKPGDNVQYLKTPENLEGLTFNSHGDRDFVIYRPVWPMSAPIIKKAETLTLPKFGLPAMRGQTSVHVLYEQSVAATEGFIKTVKLNDPTREKHYDIPESVKIFPPADVMTSLYQGKIYFPKLPPHLNKRFFYDPNRSKNGTIVLRGEFKDEIVGEKYLQLNVISESDEKILKSFSSSDEWSDAILGLKTKLEIYANKKRDDKSKIPGVYEVKKTIPIAYNKLAEINDQNIPVDSYALSASGDGNGFISLITGNGIGKVTPESDPVSIHIIKAVEELYQGELKVIYADNPLSEKVSIRHSGDFAAEYNKYDFEWRKAYPVDGQSPKILLDDNKINPQWLKIDSASGNGKASFVHGAGGTGIDTLLDVYYIIRYKPKNSNIWSNWTKAKFVEGWIKRVLAGINPFNQRVTDLYSNEANTDASMLTQAGRRWEGDVALSLQNINDFGLIEIYETVLNRGKMLSIDSDINNAGANNALLLAAGYLNDLYMMLGNEAFADASNPTIGFGTGSGDYGDIATSMFAFKGQVASLMEEESALLRGRDDFLQPDVEAAPVYNRLFWNYTRGIDSGEVIYALNYNIKERDGSDLDGNVDAADASKMYPQGHGDAYGHYLSAIKGYYRLLGDNDFQWISQTEAVSVLGQEVSVDYMDERKFAAAAVSLARTGLQVYELAWRKDYSPDTSNGWSHMSKTRLNDRRSYSGTDDEEKYSIRHWGQDHWAARVGIGSYVNWAVGNAMVPDRDPDQTHEGIKKIDRTTVLELIELADLGKELQLTADSAASGVNPLGLPENTVPFDISPDFKTHGGHMDQIYDRAVKALDNAVSAFNSSKDITQIMRTEEDSLSDLQVAVEQEELAYKHRLIEIYGTPYPDDIGPGRLYEQGYNGPDLLNYQYVNRTGLPGTPNTSAKTEYKIDTQSADVTSEFSKIDKDPYVYRFNLIKKAKDKDYKEKDHFIKYFVDNYGFFIKPDSFVGKRRSPGEIQLAISDILAARSALDVALGDADSLKGDLDVMIDLFNANAKLQSDLDNIGTELDTEAKVLAGTTFAVETLVEFLEKADEVSDVVAELGEKVIPDSVIFGFSNGGTFIKPAKAVPIGYKAAAKALLGSGQFLAQKGLSALDLAFTIRGIDLEGEKGDLEVSQSLKEALIGIGDQLSAISDQQAIINSKSRQLENARLRYASLKAEGDRFLLEREIFRKRSAAVVHGFRTRDAAFRIFRNEKLERYKSMYDLASRYTYFAAKAYDYETGQLGSDAGKRFLNRIVASRALGVVQDGKPQFAGSNMGDPGLSSVLAEIGADWSVLRGRLGINNPDTYGTTASLRAENFRILPGSAGSTEWSDLLQRSRKRDITLDTDVKKLCMQIDNSNGLPVPGIIIEFQTTIADGFNLFGKELASGDHAFSPTSYANKIAAVGVVLEGYEGMDYTITSSSNIPGIPVQLNPKGLSATPYVYLIPCGLDSMRSPPLGDQSVIRTWDVQDATIPMPFNIGGSDYETKPMWQSSDSLTEDLFNVRKHQAFRPVDDIQFIRSSSFDTSEGSHFTNSRLIGRSVWNSKWKLVIPGKTLLDDPEEGLDLFINTVNDIKIHFETYSYSGN